MMKFHLSFGIRIPHKDNTSYITKEEYKKIVAYAKERNVKIEGFKRFRGDFSLAYELIDDVFMISLDFPKILEFRGGLIISLDEHALEDDFATTVGHIIYVNAKIFNDKRYLEKEYELISDLGKFVKGTTYRSIIRHEIGHVVANVYKLSPMEIAIMILQMQNKSEIIRYVRKNLSLYSADFEDGREIISECFSAYYSGINNSFAKKYVEKCKMLAKEEL